MRIEEGELAFVFQDDTRVIKFDDCAFYRKYFNKLVGGKGVDILADGQNRIQLIEIKDCTGRETSEIIRQRIRPSKNEKAIESYDIAVAKKVASTLSCLYGAWTKRMGCQATEELLPYWEVLTQRNIQDDTKPIDVILVLEGNFQTRVLPKKKIMLDLQHSIQHQLSWLNCRVSVVDSATYSTSHALFVME